MLGEAAGDQRGHARRGIIFCLTKSEATDVHAIVQRIMPGVGRAILHTRDSPEDDKAHNLQLFTAPLEGGPLVVTATSSFGTGINASRVGWVICLGGAWSILDLIQELGRGGREGIEADCDVLWYGHHEQFLRAQAKTLRSENEFRLPRLHFTTPLSTLDYFEDARSTRCLRASIARVLDGDAMSCLITGGKECSSCQQVLSGTAPASPRPRHQQGYQVPQTTLSSPAVLGANAERRLEFSGPEPRAADESALDESFQDLDVLEGGGAFATRHGAHHFGQVVSTHSGKHH